MAELKTYGDVKDHLLMVMDHADDNTPTKGNSSISKGKYWNMIMSVCMSSTDDKECGELTVNQVLKEFPTYLRIDCKPDK